MTRWWILLGVMFIAGAVLAAVGGTTLDVIGICLGGFAAVGALSLAFLAVGRSEDRARAEEEAARRDSAPPNGDGRLDSTRLPRRRDTGARVRRVRRIGTVSSGHVPQGALPARGKPATCRHPEPSLNARR